MNKTLLEQYPVADLLEWYRQERLELNPSFQRGNIWGADARSYLIDSLLRGYPMPKIFLRTKVNAKTQQTTRDIVDGQQRLRAIIEFASGKFRLNKRAREFAGFAYYDLDDDRQEALLSYAVSVEQLIGATDEDVLEVFARLNTYTVPLNPQEQRHAKYGGEFKSTARQLSQDLQPIWSKHRLFTLKGRVRMLDDQLAAEMLGILIDGIKNAGKIYLDDLYDRYDAELPNAEVFRAQAVATSELIEARLERAIVTGFFSRPPQFLMLYAAIAHLLVGIPRGELPRTPPRANPNDIDWSRADTNLGRLASAVASDNPPKQLVPFVQAVGGATTRIASRKTRFRFVYQAVVSAV